MSRDLEKSRPPCHSADSPVYMAGTHEYVVPVCRPSIRPLSRLHLNLFSFFTHFTPPVVTFPSVALMRRPRTSRVSDVRRVGLFCSLGKFISGSSLTISNVNVPRWTHLATSASKVKSDPSESIFLWSRSGNLSAMVSHDFKG